MSKLEKVISLLFEVYVTTFIMTGHERIGEDSLCNSKMDQVRVVENRNHKII